MIAKGHIALALVFPLLILIISFFVYNMYIKIFLLGLGFGILMHDVGDMLTKGGIKRFLYPCCKEKVFRLLPKRYAFYTNSGIDNYSMFYICVIVICYRLLNYKRNI